MSKAKKVTIELTKTQAKQLGRLLSRHVMWHSCKSAELAFNQIESKLGYASGLWEELPALRGQALSRGKADRG